MNIVFMNLDMLPSTLWARDLYDQMHISSRLNGDKKTMRRSRNRKEAEKVKIP